MNEGVVFATFVVVFREALEASLILGILFTVLARLNARRYFSHVVLSAAAAVGLSVFLGLWLSGLADSTQEKAQEIIEGIVSLVAAAVLTYMFFWMESQARKIQSDIESRVQSALTARDDIAMVSLSFFAVLREGAETVLFLKAVSIQSGAGVSWAGGVVGGVSAVAVVTAIFAWGKKVPLRPLFRATGILILFMAAGLLAYGIHELEEAGWIPPVVYPLYNVNHILSEKEGIGSFLKALFGYNGNPSLVEVTAYWTYLTAVIGSAFFAGKKPRS